MRSESARAALAMALLSLLVAGCLEPEAPANTTKAAPSGPPRRFRIEHERCDAEQEGARAVEPRQGAKAALVEVSKDGVLLCRASDLNFDGRPDVFEFFEGAQLRRREVNLLDEANVGIAETFEAGRLVLVEYDNKRERRIDTWDHYGPTGKVEARERDTNGDGRVDEWWSFAANGEVTVRVDLDGDGEPDEARAPEGVRR